MKNVYDLIFLSVFDIFIIMYISGIIGEFKGVILSYENILSVIVGFNYFLKLRKELVKIRYFVIVLLNYLKFLLLLSEVFVLNVCFIMLFNVLEFSNV